MFLNISIILLLQNIIEGNKLVDFNEFNNFISFNSIQSDLITKLCIIH